MKFNYKLIRTILVGATAVLLLTGCETEKDKNMEAYRQYGINCMDQKDYEGAVSAFQKALDQSNGRIGAKELDLSFYKAEAQYLTGDYDAALDTYNTLLEYDKKNADVYYLRGNLYFTKGESEKAAEDYAKAIELDDDNYELYIGIYQSLAANDMKDDGEYYLNKALSIKGDSAEDNTQKGRIYLMLEDTAKAEEYLKKALDSDSVEANFYMAQVCQTNGDEDAAQEYIQTYLDSGKVTSEDLYQIGKQQLENEHYEQAVTYFEAGLAMDEVPNEQALMRACISAYEYKGDFASAKTMMEKYIKAYPDDQEAARENTFLQTR